MMVRADFEEKYIISASLFNSKRMLYIVRILGKVKRTSLNARIGQVRIIQARCSRFTHEVWGKMGNIR